MSLKELAEANERGRILLEKFGSKAYIFENCLISLWEIFERMAWFEVLFNSDLLAAKNAFGNCGYTDIELMNLNKGDIYSFKRTSPLYVALSDDEHLVQAYASADYMICSGPNEGRSAKEAAGLGKDHIYVDTITKSVNRNIDGVANNIEIMDKHFLKLKKSKNLLVDRLFFQGLVQSDKDVVREAINQLCTTEHKKRNKHSYYLKDIVSQPAMGYAKIAWRNGMQIEFDSPLIFNELLPIVAQANPKYEIEILKSSMTLKAPNPDYTGRKLKS